MDITVLRTTERDALLDFMLYTMGQDARQKLMHEYPAQYNRMAGADIMVVNHPAGTEVVK